MDVTHDRICNRGMFLDSWNTKAGFLEVLHGTRHRGDDVDFFREYPASEMEDSIFLGEFLGLLSQEVIDFSSSFREVVVLCMFMITLCKSD